MRKFCFGLCVLFFLVLLATCKDDSPPKAQGPKRYHRIICYYNGIFYDPLRPGLSLSYPGEGEPDTLGTYALFPARSQAAFDSCKAHPKMIPLH